MQATVVPQCQHGMPYATRNLGPVAAIEALAHQGAYHFIRLAALASGTAQPRIETAALDTERPAYQFHWLGHSVLRHKVESHIDSLVWSVATFFNMSHSILSSATSLRSYLISA